MFIFFLIFFLNFKMKNTWLFMNQKYNKGEISLKRKTTTEWSQDNQKAQLHDTKGQIQSSSKHTLFHKWI